MKKIYIMLSIAIFTFAFSKAQTINIATNPGTSGNIVVGGFAYHVSESIYLESEIGATNFITAGTAIDNIAFNCTTVGTGSSTIASPNYNIYLKNVTAATTTLATGVYTTTGYTQVYSGAFSYPATGFQSVNLTTTFVRTAGTNLQVLIVRTDNVVHTGAVFSASTGNTVAGGAALTTRRYNSATAPASGTSSLAQSNFRPQIQLKHVLANNASVDVIYTLGKMPIPNATPRTDSARISNTGTNTLTNLNVSLQITGANSFSNVQVIPTLAPGASVNVVFAPYTFTNEGINSYSVSIPTDDNNSDNTQLLNPQLVNKNTWSYAYGSTAAGGVGFNGATGDFVAKFNTNLATAISQVSVNFNTGGQPYQIGIWDATGAGGAPGTNLYTSGTLTASTGINVIPVTPATNLAVGNFYVGVRQTGTVNVGFAYQIETPIRGGTFYFTTPSGGTTWTDFAPANSFKFMIEPKLILPIDASVSNLIVPSSTTCQPNPQTYSAVLTNTGANTISAGSAALTLKVAGANTYLVSQNNTTNLISGASETINFAGVNVSNPGVNFDTLYVNLMGDLDKSNDTLKSTNTTLNTITTLPLVERYESATINIGQVTVLPGGTTPRNLVNLQTGSYTNIDLGGTLQPHNGNRMIVFDNYGGATSLNMRNRLFSTCIAVPVSGATQCSNYQLSFWLSHDNSFTTALDSVYLNVTTDGGVTWNRLLPGYARIDAAFTIPGWKKEMVSMNAYAGQTIQIGFEDVSKYGNIIALDDIQFGSVGASNITLSTATNNAVNLTPDCTDFGWTYYIDPADATKPLMAINWDPTNIGANTAAKAAATTSMQLDAADFAAEDIAAVKATYTMKRFWNVNLNSSVMTAPVNVRFFYNSADTASANAAAQTFATANGGAVRTPNWFKTVSSNFVGNSSQVQSNGIVNAIQLVNTNTTGETLNGILYAQFNAVTSFSGGTYTSGVGLATLPITVEYFNGTKQASGNLLDWKLNCTALSSVFIELQRSADGRNFKLLDAQTATDVRCQQAFDYKDANPLAGTNYYRLKVTEPNGTVKYSNIIALINKDKGFEIVSLAPNPARANATLSLATAKAGRVDIVITDVIGKVIAKQSNTLVSGNNTINMNFAQYAAGTYNIAVTNADGEVKTTRFVKY